jgi:hypothetical protein
MPPVAKILRPCPDQKFTVSGWTLFQIKQIAFKGASGMIKFLAGSCLSELGIFLKEP